MTKKKKKITQIIKEVEIFSRKTKKTRIIFPLNKEIIIYNDELNEFQLLPVVSASYDKDNVPTDERER
mgnify:CR=1 FL=1|tara:strand:- start:893 stop:1096 length:204 start_codon:yes stop_codon:yes gene_type:complete